MGILDDIGNERASMRVLRIKGAHSGLEEEFGSCLDEQRRVEQNFK